MAIAPVQSQNTNASTTTTLPSGTGLGNTVVYVVYSHDGPFSATSPAVGGSAYPAAYQALSAQSPDLAVWFSAWVFPNVPAGATAFGTTLAAGNMDPNVGSSAWEFSGLGAAPAVDVLVTGTGTSGSPSSGSTPAIRYAPELVLGFAIEYGVTLTPPGAPWTGSLQASGFCSGSYQVVMGSGGTYSYSPAGSGASWVAGVATIAPAQAPAAPPPAAQAGQTWLRRFRHRQSPPQPAPAAGAVPAVASGGLNVTGTAAATAAVTASGTLNVSGAGTGQAPAAAAAAVTLAGTAAGQAPVTAAGVLAVSGTADAAAPAPASGTLNVTGAGAGQALAPAAGSAVLAGTASASGLGAANAAGALAVTGTGTSIALAGAAGSVTVAGSAGAAAPASTAGALALTGMAAAAAPGAPAGYMGLSGTATASAPAAPAGSMALHGTAAAAGPGVTVVVTCLAVDYLAYSVIAAERLAYYTGAVDRGG